MSWYSNMKHRFNTEQLSYELLYEDNICFSLLDLAHTLVTVSTEDDLLRS